MNDIAPKLLPCPHCGEQEHLYPAYRLDKDGKPIQPPYAIDCLGCGHDFTPRDGMDARAAWNRRASPSQVAPQPQAGEAVADSDVRADGDILMQYGLNAPEQVIYTAARAVLEAFPQPANPAQVTELPDDLRLPLHSLQADLDYLLARYAAEDDEVRGMLKDSIRNRLSQIEEASYRHFLTAAIGAGGQAVAVPTVNELFANCDRWGAVEWFNRLAMAIHNRDKAVVDGDDLSFATYDNIAKSSAARLVHDFESTLRSALAHPLPAEVGREWRTMDSAPKDRRLWLAWNPEDWTYGEGRMVDDGWIACGTFYDAKRSPPYRYGEAKVEPVFWMPLLIAANRPLPAAPTATGGR